MLAPQEAILLSVLMFLFLSALILYRFLGRITFSDAAGICAVATVGTVIWAVAIGLWWGAILAAVCLLPISWNWWHERHPEDHR